MTWVAAGVASGAATHAAVQYFHNKKKLKQDAKNRPQYEIPDEVKQNLSQAQQQALEGLPEEQKQQYLSNLQRSSAYGLEQIATRKGGLSGVAELNQNQNQGYQNLLSMDAQARRENQGMLMNARNEVAGYKDQSFQFNKVNPYYEGIAARNANEGALSKSLSNAGQMVGGMNFGGGQKQTSNTPQYGKIGQNGNMYNYNAYNNKQGIVPDGNPYGNMGSYG